MAATQTWHPATMAASQIEYPPASRQAKRCARFSPYRFLRVLLFE
jgi:hypothetical protein